MSGRIAWREFQREADESATYRQTGEYMNNILMMLLAFLIFAGIVLLHTSTLQVNMGEGAVLSAASIMMCLAVSGIFAGTFRYGMWGIYAAALIGVLLCLVCTERRGSWQMAGNGWPIMLTLFGVFFACLFLYYNDFIQHTDEFHQWAAAVKYMLEKDKLPTGTDFIGGSGQNCFASSLFFLFFQKIGGYNEQNMYVASTFLMTIGFLLPLSNAKGRDLKKVLLYIAILFVAIYSLYTYGTKSLYVDVPMAAWAGGLAGWWMTRKKQKRNLSVFIAGLIVLCFIKPSSGALMALYVLVFAISYYFLIERGVIEKQGATRVCNIVTIVLVACVLLGSCLIILLVKNIRPMETLMTMNGQDVVEKAYQIGSISLPTRLGNMLEVYSVSMEKIKKTMGSFLGAAVGAPMGSKSNLRLAFLPFSIFLMVLLGVYGELYKKKRENVFYRNYMILMSLSSCAILFFSYIFLFAYKLSVTTRSSTRYFSACAIFWLMIVLTLFLQNLNGKREFVRKYLVLGLLLLFLLGLNAKYIPNMTALDKEEVTGYEDIQTAKARAEEIETILDENDKIYFIYQFSGDDPGAADLVNNSVLYYFETQISNYGYQAWHFYEGGCNVAIEDFASPTLNDLPAILTSGGYTYVWIYRSDKYLREILPQVMECESQDSGLYRVIYKDGIATGLELVKSL